MTEEQMMVREEQTRKVRPQEAATMMGVSLRAVYNRIQKYGWKTETDIENRAWIYLPERFVKLHECIENEPEVSANEGIRELSGSVLESFRQIYEEEIEALRSRLESVHGETRTLQGSLMKAEVECAEMRGKLEKINEMERTIVALNDALNQAKTANEALANERVAITQQLVKYREENNAPEGKSRAWWQFWGS